MGHDRAAYFLPGDIHPQVEGGGGLGCVDAHLLQPLVQVVGTGAVVLLHPQTLWKMSF